MFFSFHIYSFSCIQIRQTFFVVWSHKFSVIFYLTRIHIYSITCNGIGISFFCQGCNQIYLFLNMIGCSWHLIEFIDMQKFHSIFENLFIFFCNIPS